MSALPTRNDEIVLIVLFMIYLIMGYDTPESVANMVDSVPGKISVFLVVIYMFLNNNKILAILGVFVAYDLITRSSAVTGSDYLAKYMPSENKNKNI